MNYINTFYISTGGGGAQRGEAQGRRADRGAVVRKAGGQGDHRRLQAAQAADGSRLRRAPDLQRHHRHRRPQGDGRRQPDRQVEARLGNCTHAATASGRRAHYLARCATAAAHRGRRERRRERGGRATRTASGATAARFVRRCAAARSGGANRGQMRGVADARDAASEWCAALGRVDWRALRSDGQLGRLRVKGLARARRQVVTICRVTEILRAWTADCRTL